MTHRQKLDSVNAAFRSMVSLELSCSCASSGRRAPLARTRSRQSGESPAMFPSAHTACSRTSSFGLARRRTKIGTAPKLITTRVCSLVPEAIFVNAQAAYVQKHKINQVNMKIQHINIMDFMRVPRTEAQGDHPFAETPRNEARLPHR